MAELKDAQELEELGFKGGDTTKSSPAPSTTATEPAKGPSGNGAPSESAPASPKASTSQMPGAGASTPSRGANADMMDKLVPGAGDRIR